MNTLPLVGIVPTVSEDESHGEKVVTGDLSSLPRSVRWRILLGLLNEPTTSHGDLRQGQDGACTLKSVEDYNRGIIAQQNERFKVLVEKHVEEDETEQDARQREERSSLNDASAAGQGLGKAHEVDPLTFMVMEEEARETRKAELYLKYRKEKARRKRGLTTEAKIIDSESDEVDRASLVIIEKDLKRLPHPTEAKQSLSGGFSSAPLSSPEHDARITSLREILYIYAQEHTSMGYRQGMHEIASYILFVLELEHQQYPEHPLFNPILPICFALLERVLDQLKTAYDASGGKSLQQMSISILGKILQNSPPLYHLLTSNPNIPPPPIYCTRWVRLMFSREVVGYENVLKVWDFLFSYSNLMHALEIASASRILLLRGALLVPDNNTLDLLMNAPPLDDITPLTQTLEKLMNQKETDRPVQLPQSTQQLDGLMTLSTPVDAVSMQKPSSPSMSWQQLQMPPSSPIVHQHQQQHPLEGSGMVFPSHPSHLSADGESKFSFSKMRQTLGRSSESLKQKIITTTNEWKEASARRESNNGNFSSMAPGARAGSASFDPLFGTLFPDGGVLPEQPEQPQSTFFDPLWHPQLPAAPPTRALPTTPVTTSNDVPKTPKQHQHEMWSQLLQQKIWTVQEFLLALESKENEGSVPRDVWEALADMDRMQRELLNYSRNMGSESSH